MFFYASFPFITSTSIHLCMTLLFPKEENTCCQLRDCTHKILEQSVKRTKKTKQKQKNMDLRPALSYSYYLETKLIQLKTAHYAPLIYSWGSFHMRLILHTSFSFKKLSRRIRLRVTSYRQDRKTNQLPFFEFLFWGEMGDFPSICLFVCHNWLFILEWCIIKQICERTWTLWLCLSDGKYVFDV